MTLPRSLSEDDLRVMQRISLFRMCVQKRRGSANKECNELLLLVPSISFYESATLRALRGHVTTCLTYFRAHVLMCLRCLHAHVPTCLACYAYLRTHVV